MAQIENTYVGDGSTVLYSFTFPYIEAQDVKVSVDGVDTTEYSFANATTVEFNSAPADGTAIRIYRSTQLESVSASFFPGSVIRAQDLNDNFEQTLFVVQEAIETVNSSDATSVLNVANQALSTAQQAETTAALAQTAAQNAVDTAISAGDNVSELTNDAGYLTTAVQAGDNISTLTNDAGYTTAAGVPVGAVFHFVATAVPAGYLKCNGDTIPNGTGTVQGVTADFSALFGLVGATLPDLRGEFIRGADDGRGVDSGRSVNTTQNATAIRTAIASHQINNAASTELDVSAGINFAEPDTFSGEISPSGARFGDNGTGWNSNYENNILLGGQDTSGAGRNTWITTRPRNVALLACIKY